jgi:hypothetical protein
MIDTGSSNTWVGANQHYKKTDTSVKTGNSVVSIMSQGLLVELKLKLMDQSVTYGAGFFKGYCSLD